VYAVSFKYVKDQELAMEITHDIFLNIWNKREKLSINSFQNYVVTAASYHGIRKNREKKTVLIKYIEDYQFDGEVLISKDSLVYNDGHEKLMAEELDQKIKASLDGLPKRCREIYQMSRNENLSISEIATKLDISKRTVENQITIALRHLKSFLSNATLFF
jgi:RNA polymerase sigma factor (sigma-70 family)